MGGGCCGGGGGSGASSEDVCGDDGTGGEGPLHVDARRRGEGDF